MKNNSKNVLDFFANTKERFHGKRGIYLATLISVLPFMALIFAAAWLSQLVHGLFAIILVVAVVFVGNMQVGHIRYVREVAEGKNPSLKILFSGFGKNMLFYLYLGIVMFIIYVISTVLFIIPLFYAIGAFSMVFYFAEHHNYDNFLDALSTTQKRMRKQKANMFAYKVMFYIFYVLATALFFIALVMLLRIDSAVTRVLLIIVLHVLYYLLFSYITSLFSMCNFNFFIEVLDYHERKSKKDIPVEIEENKAEEKQEQIAKVSATDEPKKEVKATTTKTAKTSATTKTSTTKAEPKKAEVKKAEPKKATKASKEK